MAKAKTVKKLRDQGLSGLTGKHRRNALRLTIQAARLGLKKAPAIDYTQGADRWEGINKDRKAWKGQYPRHADCSSFVTWCIWNGLDHYGIRDVVNGANWKAGYTGTMVSHGKRVRVPRRGDEVHYGNAFGSSGHVAIYVGRGMVISHGSDGAPYFLPVHYRRDFSHYRRVI